MSEMAASFYLDVKRVSNVKLKTVLGVQLRYPTYREGLSALMEAGSVGQNHNRLHRAKALLHW
jgi:hypothetical protein